MYSVLIFDTLLQGDTLPERPLISFGTELSCFILTAVPLFPFWRVPGGWQPAYVLTSTQVTRTASVPEIWVYCVYTRDKVVAFGDG